VKKKEKNFAICVDGRGGRCDSLGMNLEQFGKNAVARYYARHAKADDLQYNSATYTWNAKIKRYEIEVRNYIVATVATLAEVKAFSAMHNADRIA
jgi:hypothetical protein